MKSTMMSSPLSVNAILARAKAFFPGSQIVSRLPNKSMRRHSYAEIATRTHALSALGFDRVATLCWNHHAHLECYFAVPLAGAVMHTLNLTHLNSDQNSLNISSSSTTSGRFLTVFGGACFPK